MPSRINSRGSRRAVVATVVMLSAAGAAAASEAESAGDRPPAGVAGSGRYAMAPVDGGFLRMDTDTGVVSLCARKGGNWACETVPDDYKAIQKDVDRLTQENAGLRKELADLRRDGPGVPAKPSERKLELPSEEDVDRAIGQLDKYLKKFKELIEKHTGGGVPDRT